MAAEMENGCEVITRRKQLRSEGLLRRAALSEEEKKRAALLITERICGHQWFYLSDTVLLFVSTGSEINTSFLFEEAFKRGKKVYVPKVEGERMEFYRIFSMQELKPGFKGILEPDGESERFDYSPEGSERVLMLMPGAAFDRNRERLGYGGGFYDKYLQDKEELSLHTIAIGYSCQLTEEIPVLEWDVRPYQIILV